MTLLGVDVSHWQGVAHLHAAESLHFAMPDPGVPRRGPTPQRWRDWWEPGRRAAWSAASPAWWRSAHDAGIVFGFAKATEGSSYRDPTFAANIAGMRSAAVVPGAYHFLGSGNGAAQADYFTAAVGQVNGGTAAGMLCALDAEAGSWVDVQAFAARWHARTSQTLIVYTGGWFWSGTLGNPSGRALGPLWHSRYPASNPGPAASQWSALGASQQGSGFVPGYGGWPRAAIWQFTSNATVAGTAVDADAYEGSLASLQALAGTSDTGGLMPNDIATILAQLAAVKGDTAYIRTQGISIANAVAAASKATLTAIAADPAIPITQEQLNAAMAGAVDPAVLAAGIASHIPPAVGGDPNAIRQALADVLRSVAPGATP